MSPDILNPATTGIKDLKDTLFRIAFDSLLNFNNFRMGISIPGEESPPSFIGELLPDKFQDFLRMWMDRPENYPRLEDDQLSIGFRNPLQTGLTIAAGLGISIIVILSTADAVWKERNK